MKWAPITSEELNRLIRDSEAQLNDAGKNLWDSIRVVPQKWQLHPWGDEGGGFWVVAVFYNKVIYYNDIEDGFNISTFKEHGKIDEYFCDDKELHEVIYSLTEAGDENEGTSSDLPEVHATCSGCYQSLPESKIHVIPIYRGEVYGYITAYRCDDCWTSALDETKKKILSTESTEEIASAANFFEIHGHYIHEFRSGESNQVVKQALLYLIDGLKSGRLKLSIR